MGHKRVSRVAFKVLLLCLLSAAVYLPAAELIKTPAEAVNYVQYSQYEEIARFLSRLEHIAPELAVQVIGRTLPTRNYAARDLLVCILTEDGSASPDKLDRSKPTFYVIAAKHGNEQSAKEAALRLIRDLAVGELRPLLQKVNVLVLPAANPFGHWFDQRRNEQDLDLNRDMVKLESPESTAIHRVFRTWMPEVTFDVHEKGDDYYRVSIGCVSNVNIHSQLQEFQRQILISEVAEALAKQKITFHEYLITQAMGIDSSAGVSYGSEDTAGRQMMKRYSTTDLNDGRNSPGIYETLSFIQEGASRHDLATLRARTDYQYFGIRFMLESVALHGKEINTLVRKLRTDLVSRAASFSGEDLVHLRMHYARDLEQPTLSIQQFQSSRSPIRGILKVDKKAGEAITSAEMAPNPAGPDYEIREEVIENWFPLVEPTVSVSRPLGYIIPSAHEDVVDTLLRHGIRLQFFTKDAPLEIEAYQITDIIPAQYDYLPPSKIEVEQKTLQTIAKRGDIYVSCEQPAANLIPSLLEPQSQYGLIRYWMYRLVPEKGDVFPFFRVTKSADLPLIPFRNWD
jgi:hypothetical protein